MAKSFSCSRLELAVGELEPERVTAEGPPRLDARDQIPDEGLGGQNLAHLFLLATRDGTARSWFLAWDRRSQLIL